MPQSVLVLFYCCDKIPRPMQFIEERVDLAYESSGIGVQHVENPGSKQHTWCLEQKVRAHILSCGQEAESEHEMAGGF